MSFQFNINCKQYLVQECLQVLQGTKILRNVEQFDKNGVRVQEPEFFDIPFFDILSGNTNINICIWADGKTLRSAMTLLNALNGNQLYSSDWFSYSIYDDPMLVSIQECGFGGGSVATFKNSGFYHRIENSQVEDMAAITRGIGEGNPTFPFPVYQLTREGTNLLYDLPTVYPDTAMFGSDAP